LEKYPERLARVTKQRQEKYRSENFNNFITLGRKAARILRKKKKEGLKGYSAEQEVAKAIGEPWTQIRYAIELHNNKLFERYERLRNREIFKLWAEKGWTIKRIAKRFNKHPKTISVWIKNIQSKKGSL